MTDSSTFESLVAEATSEPVEGWDFSWLSGRATEGRPTWRYFEGLVKRMEQASSVLDVQTGGGERYADALSYVGHRPSSLAATESWPVNVEVARQNLRPFGVTVVEVPDEGALPFADETFDLVCSRHPTVTVWVEIERVLRPGGIFYSQQNWCGNEQRAQRLLPGATSGF